MEQFIDTLFEPISKEMFLIPDEELKTGLNYLSHKSHYPLSFYDDPDNLVRNITEFVCKKYKFTDFDFIEFLVGEMLGKNEYLTDMPINELERRINKTKF